MCPHCPNLFIELTGEPLALSLRPRYSSRNDIDPSGMIKLGEYEQALLRKGFETNVESVAI